MSIQDNNGEKYKGKSKCSCGKRAKYRATNGAMRWFACEEHKSRIAGRNKEVKETPLTEADYQTWMKI